MLQVECWGGGGAGDCGGGGGGGYLIKNYYSVTPGDVIDGSVGGFGGDSWFVDSSTFIAHGGGSASGTSHGSGGTASGGDTNLTGSDGTDGSTGCCAYGDPYCCNDDGTYPDCNQGTCQDCISTCCNSPGGGGAGGNNDGIGNGCNGGNPPTNTPSYGAIKISWNISYNQTDTKLPRSANGSGWGTADQNGFTQSCTGNGLTSDTTEDNFCGVTTAFYGGGQYISRDYGFSAIDDSTKFSVEVVVKRSWFNICNGNIPQDGQAALMRDDGSGSASLGLSDNKAVFVNWTNKDEWLYKTFGGYGIYGDNYYWNCELKGSDLNHWGFGFLYSVFYGGGGSGCYYGAEQDAVYICVYYNNLDLVSRGGAFMGGTATVDYQQRFVPTFTVIAFGRPVTTELATGLGNNQKPVPFILNG